jgi:surface antigen
VTGTLKKAALIALLCTAIGLPALADPPAHAPAHGWRKKHDPHYVGYSGKEWDHDYGVRTGSCDRQAIATVLGGVVGGAVGSRVADDEHRAIAIILGTAVGALIGNKIGRELDEADRSCLGHALEVGDVGRPVIWDNPFTGMHYELTPGKPATGSGQNCRAFTLRATHDGDVVSRTGVACQARAGVWDQVKT